MNAEGVARSGDGVLRALKLHLDNCATRMSEKEAKEIAELVCSRDDEFLHVHACILAGVCLVNHGFYEEAILPLSRAAGNADCENKRGSSLHLLGAAHSGLGDQTRALECFAQARELLAPESVEMGILLRDEALALCRAGKYDLAVEVGRQALVRMVAASAGAPSLGRCWYVVALISLNRKEKESAVQCALRVRELWGNANVPRHWRKELKRLLLSIRVSFLLGTVIL